MSYCSLYSGELCYALLMTLSLKDSLSSALDFTINQNAARLGKACQMVSSSVEVSN